MSVFVYVPVFVWGGTGGEIAHRLVEGLALLAAIWGIPGIVRAGRRKALEARSALGRRIRTSARADVLRAARSRLRWAWGFVVASALLGALVLLEPSAASTASAPWEGGFLLGFAALVALAAARATVRLRDEGDPLD
jgi:hypothetical protein